MNLFVFFPYPKMSWEDAYQWSKERGYLKSSTGILQNPNHWDRADLIARGIMGENWFCWEFMRKE
jgi:hypothetical protein